MLTNTVYFPPTRANRQMLPSWEVSARMAVKRSKKTDLVLCNACVCVPRCLSVNGAEESSVRQWVNVSECSIRVGGFLSNMANRLVGLVVKASAPREGRSGVRIPLAAGFSGSSHTSDSKIGTPVAPCQAPGVRGTALGLVGPVSVYCDWVR